MSRRADGRKWRAGVLGATGMVGQRLVKLLADHPWFELTAVAASERSSGKAEEDFARAGYPVVSNSRNHRMDADVPLLIPEVNASHVDSIRVQQKNRGYDSGFIVTNPNCSTAGLVLVLKPLADAFGLEKIFVVTLQAVSGAGYPGVPSLDILGNVVPFISGEEEKMEAEPQKLLGKWDGSRFVEAGLGISAHCNRVPVSDGHLECVSLRLKKTATLDEVRQALRTFEVSPELASLPTGLKHPIVVQDEENRRGEAQRIDAIQNAAPSLDHPAKILDADVSLDRADHQPAGEAQNAYGERHARGLQRRERRSPPQQSS